MLFLVCVPCTETSPDEDEACDQIDFDIGDEGGAEIDFDLGEEGVQGLNLEVGDIDWGDIGDTPEGILHAKTLFQMASNHPETGSLRHTLFHHHYITRNGVDLVNSSLYEIVAKGVECMYGVLVHHTLFKISNFDLP